MTPGPYSVELIQTDPPDSPTPGLGHYAGELRGFTTSTEALSAGIARLGKPLGEEFDPCCDFQTPEGMVTGVLVYWEDERGEGRDAHPTIQAQLKESAPCPSTE